MRISPSIASSNLIDIKGELKKIGTGFDSLHVDVEDGNFVGNITFGLKMIRSIREITDIAFSVHLMVMNPGDYLEELFKLNCSHIFIHGETTQYLKKYLYKIKDNNIKAGLALNPLSKIEDYEYLYDDLDAILYLTSEIDGHGELLQQRALDKIKILSNVETWADGGINFENLYRLPKKVDYVVMGRAIFSMDNPSKSVSKTY